MTDQEAFDTIWDWFVVQKKPQVAKWYVNTVGTDGQICYYRSPEGNRCAVGILIPDDLYKEDFEGKSIQAVAKQNRSVKDYFQGVSMDLLRKCQIAHDDSTYRTKQAFTNHMQRSLTIIARRYSLQLPRTL